MIVRLDTSLIWNGRLYENGDTIDLPDEVALKYIATRQAERIETAALHTTPVKGKKDVRIQATR